MVSVALGASGMHDSGGAARAPFIKPHLIMSAVS